MLIQQNSGTTVVVDGKTYIYFGGTNYLGMAHRHELLNAASDAFFNFGFSSGASRLTSGESEILVRLENELADFAGCEAALVLPAGYVSNFAVVDALEDLADGWCIQKTAHGSIRSALKHSKHEYFEIDDRNPVRPGSPSKKLAWFLEPVEPLTGNLMDPAIVLSKMEPSDYLILDEAHSFGVLGARGSGALCEFDIAASPQIARTGTFSKALGTHGGFVLGSGDLIARIIEKSSAYRASTPLSPVVVAAARESLRILRAEPETSLLRLRTNISLLNESLRVESGIHSNRVPIFYLPDATAHISLQSALKEDGLYVPQVGSYFAGASNIGLRWTVQANHSTEQLALLISVLRAHLSCW